MGDYKVVFNIVPYLITDMGFARSLSAEEVRAVELDIPALAVNNLSYFDALVLLKKKIKKMQEILNETE